MEDFETKALASFNQPEAVLFWLRKADDTLVAIHNDHAEALFTHINSIHQDIKWTKEDEVNNCIHMLDVNIQRQTDGSLSFDVYRKPTHTNQYIHFASHAPLDHKVSTIRSLTRRAAIIPSTQEARKNEDKRIKSALALNGYPDWAIKQGTYRPKLPTDANTAATPTAATPKPQRRGHVTLPHHAGITEPIARVLRRAGITSSVRSRGSLREQLVRPKDKLEKNEVNGVVYYTHCAGLNGVPCQDDYVGESVRDVTARHTEHFSTAQTAPGIYKSAIMQHAADAHHHFRLGDVKILAREGRWHDRGIRESIYICALSPTLNRNDGRHTLPHGYDPIIRNALQKPEAPHPHQPSEPRLNTTPRGPGRPRKEPRPQTDSQTAAKETSSQPTARPTRQQQQQQQQQPATHVMATRSRAARIQEDRSPPD